MNVRARLAPLFKAYLILVLCMHWVPNAAAHHSFAMFDSQNQVKMTGAVTLVWRIVFADHTTTHPRLPAGRPRQ